MSGRPKICVFCGATPLSKEHIWSEWTYEILPKVKGSHVRGVSQSAKGNPKIKGLRYIKNYQGEVNTIQVRAVCRSKSKKGGTNSLGKTGCNNGWMNHQEEAVKPIASPLILGKSFTLGQKEQRILSSWLATKLMVAEQNDPESAVSTQDERTSVMQTLTAPARWSIWIARQTARGWRTGYELFSATLGPLDSGGTPIPPDGSLAKNTQLVSLGIGFLFVHVFSTRVPEAQIGYPDGVLRRIHPFSGAAISWPPTETITDPGIEFLMRRYDEHLGRIPWTSSD
jgi:hypothetical protein